MSKIGDNMRNGYKVTLSILTIMILITLTIGTSYSYYSVASEQTNPNELTTTCFDVSFTDTDVINLNATGNYMYPMSEATALSKLTPYKFTITNNCTSTNASSGVNYVVTINTLTAEASTLTNYLNYKLNVTSPTAVAGTTALLTANPYELNPNIKTDQGIDTSYSLDTGILAPGESKTYNLYLWIDESVGNEVMGYNFTGKVLIYSYM